MDKFNEWFKDCLSIKGYPRVEELDDYQYVINVSDEVVIEHQIRAGVKNIRYFWFPMDETSGDMGMNSIYGACVILNMAETEHAKTLIHCHAGALRSVTIADAYYYIRTGAHRLGYIDRKVEADVHKACGDKEYKPIENILLNGIERGRLPAKAKVEVFLQTIGEVFKKENKGGWLDMAKINSGLSVVA